MVRSLKDLIQEADQFLATDQGHSKEASPVSGFSSEISSLAESCISASEIIESGAFNNPLSKTASSEYEKLAMAVNRVHAKAQADDLARSAQFSEHARENGYTEYQIEEALSKVAAKKVKHVLPILAAIDGYAAPGAGVNSLEKVKLPAKGLPNADKMKDASRAVGE